MKIIESPREGMQGFSRIIPTMEKVTYINQLLRVGFDTVEVGSIVSSRLIPQMADSLEVVKKIDRAGSHSNIMFLAVNFRGAEAVAGVGEITHISYPFSFSPTFLKLNVNSTVEESFSTVERVAVICSINKKAPVIYISMAFGNPYGDPWSFELLAAWAGKLYNAGARVISLSNVSMEIDATLIRNVFSMLIPLYPEVEFGLHLHTANKGWREKVNAAWEAGCRRFDGVMEGWGGCPMAGRDLLGNLDTGNLITFANENSIPGTIDMDAFAIARRMSGELFAG